jgi:hypothetical protein
LHDLSDYHIDGQCREAFPKRPQRSHTIRLLRNSEMTESLRPSTEPFAPVSPAQQNQLKKQINAPE